MAKCLTLFFSLSFTLLGSFSSATEGPTETHVARIAMGLSKPPYIIQETESGLECDILREAFKAVGITFQPTFVSLNRGELLFKTAQVDGVINKQTGSLKGYPSDTYIEYHNVAASLQSRNLVIQKIGDLQGYSVGSFQTAKNLLGVDFKAMTEKNSRYYEVADQQAQVEQAMRKRVDVIVGDILIFKYYQRKFKEELGLTEELAVHNLFPKNSYVLMFQTEKLRNEFNKGLAIIRKNKTYSILIDKYMHGSRDGASKKKPSKK